MALAQILGDRGQIVDNAGNPLAGGLVNVYFPNTTNRITSYRDSALVSHLFDERDGSVKALIALVIETCKDMGKKVGLCGQAPSDYPDEVRDISVPDWAWRIMEEQRWEIEEVTA